VDDGLESERNELAPQATNKRVFRRFDQDSYPNAVLRTRVVCA
jgi:hypothetical protein